MKHVQAKHHGPVDSEHDSSCCYTCTLSICEVCGGAEGELPTECPGYTMSEEERGLVYTGKLDYKNDQWVKTSDVLRQDAD